MKTKNIYSTTKTTACERFDQSLPLRTVSEISKAVERYHSWLLWSIPTRKSRFDQQIQVLLSLSVSGWESAGNPSVDPDSGDP